MVPFPSCPPQPLRACWPHLPRNRAAKCTATRTDHESIFSLEGPPSRLSAREMRQERVSQLMAGRGRKLVSSAVVRESATADVKANLPQHRKKRGECMIASDLGKKSNE